MNAPSDRVSFTARALLVAVLVFAVAAPASAALPPFELVQQSLTKARRGKVELAFDVTLAAKTIETFRLEGSTEYGKTAKLVGKTRTVELSAQAALGERLLWIALLADEPVKSLASFGFVNVNRAEVGVEEDFIYIYGTNPRVAVDRDLHRLAWFEVNVDGVLWRASVTYDGPTVTAAKVTRAGAPYLSARRRP